MSQLGWIDFSRTHRDKVMLVMDLFKEQGVVDELGIGTIRDSLSDLLFPGTSTIQTRAKYFLLIPWIIQDIESRGKIDRFQTELEESETHFIKTLRSNSQAGGIIGATLRNANPKRKPSSIYWNGLRTYGILNFKGSITDYINYSKYHNKKLKNQKKQVVESEGNVIGDDKDANHLYQQHLWSQLPHPQINWKTNLTIDLTKDEASFLKERIVRSNPTSLWAFTLKNELENASSFSSIDDFLSLNELNEELRELVKLSIDFNSIMKGALIRYNLLIQKSREKGRLKELNSAWSDYLSEMNNLDWNTWDIDLLWKYCQFTPIQTKKFIENWIQLVKNGYNETKGDQLLKDRELKLKGIKRARLYDKAIAQKQQTFTGISILEDGSVSYLTYRWGTVRTFLNDIKNGLENVTAE